VGLGDILDAGLFVQSSYLVIQFRSPPHTPLALLFIRSSGIVSLRKFSLEMPSVLDLRFSMLKNIVLPMVSILTFSVAKQFLMIVAVPYLLRALLDRM
jgi:hypothetical protein